MNNKVFDIAIKDLKHTFQNAFSLVMMFAAPLLLTGLLAFAFGGMAGEDSEFNLPITQVHLVNLDLAGTQGAGLAAGEMLAQFLLDPSLGDMLAVQTGADEAGARAAVDARQADVAVIIPAGFTEAVTSPGRTAAVTLYHDPTLTIGPGIVQDLVNHFMDAFSGAKIAGQVAASTFSARSGQGDPAIAAQAAQQYAAWVQSSGHAGNNDVAPLTIISPAGQAQASPQQAIPIGTIMAGMTIFFMFFIGANGAEGIIREDEEGTLARLLTTPTAPSAILGGKFLGVVVSLCIQVALLLLSSALLFRIRWGHPVTVVLVAAGLVIAAAGFGVMMMSFIKNSRQTGPVMGGALTLVGMLGGLFTTGIPNLPPAAETVSLITPHGWALQGWKLALSGATPGQTLVPVLVLVGMGFVFLAVGTALFRKRFA